MGIETEFTIKFFCKTEARRDRIKDILDSYKGNNIYITTSTSDDGNWFIAEIDSELDINTHFYRFGMYMIYKDTTDTHEWLGEMDKIEEMLYIEKIVELCKKYDIQITFSEFIVTDATFRVAQVDNYGYKLIYLNKEDPTDAIEPDISETVTTETSYDEPIPF